MKKGLKALLLVACAIVLVVATVFTTLAYMTSKSETITNTFSVGNVKITMDETVYVDGEATSSRDDNGNTYKMIPGSQYIKDPIIHVDAQSEDAYIFVKVVKNDPNSALVGLALTDDWALVGGDGNENVYYSKTKYVSPDGVKDYNVFKTLDGAANGETVQIATTVKNDATQVSVDVTGYAIQAQGFDTAVAAWNAAKAELGA